MKIGIVGWGVHGQGAYKFFGPQHSYLIVNEQPSDDFPPQSDKVQIQFIRSDKPPGLTGNVKDLSYLEGLDKCDQIIYTPTAYKNLRQVYGNNERFWSKVTTEEKIFFETARTKNIIGVTGTKGKGTTATLIYRLLEAAGHKTYFAGNVGVSLFDFVREVQPDDWVVLELSNFQLYELEHSPHIGVCLMVVPEHLDWHANMDEYIEAKAHLFKHQKPDDIAIYFAQNANSKKIAAYSPGKKVPYFEPPGAFVRNDGMIMIGETEVIAKTEVKLLGDHNLQNICAALTAVFEAVGERDPSGIVRNSGIPRGQSSGASRVNAVGGSTWIDKAKQVLSSFGGLEHRLELVRELQGVKYYDDSFSATPEAAAAAIKAVSGPKVMILGGFDRHLPLSNLVDTITAHSPELMKLLLIGASATRLAKELETAGFHNYQILTVKTMPEIVAAAQRSAKNDDAVVLSPGFPSFDMFRNFEVRGHEFKKAINSL